MRNEIEESKEAFNRFFHDDLYGQFKSDNNIILSRGGWEDNYIHFPKLVFFCVNKTLKNHWTGYSDSLGHRNTLAALQRLLSVQHNLNYSTANLALTIGNVITLGLVFRQLKTIIPDTGVITVKPYYPPVLKSVAYCYDRIEFISSLESEEIMLQKLEAKVRESGFKILFLSNSIGVEGRIFSVAYWDTVMRIVEENEMYLVIDEGLWFEELLYPSSIQSDRVVRVVSLSKKYGLPGCKLGFMVAGEGFINNFYDYASTNYGGPLSVFFLLAEFIYQFEYILYSGTPLQDGLQVLSEQYDTSIIKLEHLYFDFIRSIQNNERKLSANRESLATWVHKHPKLIDKAFDFGGVNVFIKLRKNLKAYGLFLDLIQYSGVSILPSSCLGDETDSMIRITLLEKNTSFKKGLSSLKHLLRSYEAYDV